MSDLHWHIEQDTGTITLTCPADKPRQLPPTNQPNAADALTAYIMLVLLGCTAVGLVWVLVMAGAIK